MYWTMSNGNLWNNDWNDCLYGVSGGALWSDYRTDSDGMYRTVCCGNLVRGGSGGLFGLCRGILRNGNGTDSIHLFGRLSGGTIRGDNGAIDLHLYGGVCGGLLRLRNWIDNLHLYRRLSRGALRGDSGTDGVYLYGAVRSG